MRIEFFVEGVAKPAGSKSAFAIKGKDGTPTGQIVVTDTSGVDGKKWREKVKIEARRAYRGHPLEDCPLSVVAIFYRERPKFHFGTGRNKHLLKPNAPKYPLPQPDCSKVFRAVEDAMTGIIYKDDSQIVAQMVRKKYCDESFPRPGVLVRIEVME